VELVRPARLYLDGYIDALQRGWSADNVRGAAAAREELTAIERDPDAFLAGCEDLEAKGPPLTMPDGTTMNRLPGYRRWLWDGAFCGSIGFRFQRGTSALPPGFPFGHIGYAVVPWKRRQGYATRALALLLEEIRPFGLHSVLLTTDVDNRPSQRVIENVGGLLVERFEKPAYVGGGPALLWRIDLG